MTFKISQRGKGYLEVAQTLLRAAQTMTDTAIASQLKALADAYERRAEKVSLADMAKAARAQLLTLQLPGVKDPIEPTGSPSP